MRVPDRTDYPLYPKVSEFVNEIREHSGELGVVSLNSGLGTGKTTICFAAAAAIGFRLHDHPRIDSAGGPICIAIITDVPDNYVGLPEFPGITYLIGKTAKVAVGHRVHSAIIDASINEDDLKSLHRRIRSGFSDKDGCILIAVPQNYEEYQMVRKIQQPKFEWNETFWSLHPTRFSGSMVKIYIPQVLVSFRPEDEPIEFEIPIELMPDFQMDAKNAIQDLLGRQIKVVL